MEDVPAEANRECEARGNGHLDADRTGRTPGSPRHRAGWLTAGTGEPVGAVGVAEARGGMGEATGARLPQAVRVSDNNTNRWISFFITEVLLISDAIIPHLFRD